MGGTWTTDAYVAKVNGFIKNDDNAPVINVNGGTYTSTDSTALYASGYGIWTINGTVKGAQAIAVRSGKVTVTGGTYIATDDNNEGSHDGDTQYALAILGTENNVDSVNYNDPKYIDVTVKGGEFTAKEDGAYAIYLGDITKDTKLAFTGGKYTSGEGSNGKQLPAMKIKNLNEDFLEDHKGIITGGEFASGLIEEIEIGLEKYTVEDLTKALTGAEYKTENGNTVVGNGSATQDPSAGDDQQPSEQKPSTGDNQPSENPKTFDAIGSLVTMAISSLGVVGTATKKYLR